MCFYVCACVSVCEQELELWVSSQVLHKTHHHCKCVCVCLCVCVCVCVWAKNGADRQGLSIRPCVCLNRSCVCESGRGGRDRRRLRERWRGGERERGKGRVGVSGRILRVSVSLKHLSLGVSLLAGSSEQTLSPRPSQASQALPAPVSEAGGRAAR